MQTAIRCFSNIRYADSYVDHATFVDRHYTKSAKLEFPVANDM
jgi:hypothetical protein